MRTTRYCKGCRFDKAIDDFVLKFNGKEYKTCISCRNRNKKQN